jgi:mono/diheme cytochrome c family protein
MRPFIGVVVAFVVVSGWNAFSQERSVWDGVYTEGQATRGQTLFGDNCARCHNAEVDFKGGSFLDSWDAATMLDFFRQLQRSMPMDNPGSLQPQEYVDVVAYLFRVNEFPAGKTELDSDAEKLKLIRIEKKK